MLQSINVNAELFGAELAVADDKEQGSFFKGFAAELRHFPTHHHIGLQGATTHDKLAKEDRETLREYFDCLLFEEK